MGNVAAIGSGGGQWGWHNEKVGSECGIKHLLEITFPGAGATEEITMKLALDECQFVVSK